MDAQSPVARDFSISLVMMTCHTRHMDAPPREQRARAAFFREKEARRIAKKQRKKDRLLAKVAQAANAADVAPPLPQSYSSWK